MSHTNANFSLDLQINSHKSYEVLPKKLKKPFLMKEAFKTAKFEYPKFPCAGSLFLGTGI